MTRRACEDRAPKPYLGFHEVPSQFQEKVESWRSFVTHGELVLTVKVVLQEVCLWDGTSRWSPC